MDEMVREAVSRCHSAKYQLEEEMKGGKWYKPWITLCIFSAVLMSLWALNPVSPTHVTACVQIAIEMLRGGKVEAVVCVASDPNDRRALGQSPYAV